MIDPNEIESGDVLIVEILTVYQDIEADIIIDDMPVYEVEQTVDEDDGTEITTVYLEYERDENDGYPIRRIVFRGPNPEYQLARGDPSDPTWAKFSRDDYCHIREADVDETEADAVEA